MQQIEIDRSPKYHITDEERSHIHRHVPHAYPQIRKAQQTRVMVIRDILSVVVADDLIELTTRPRYLTVRKAHAAFQATNMWMQQVS